MNEDVNEVRQQDRFLAVEPLNATLDGLEVSVLNVSVAGAQIQHAQPLRIGTTALLHADYRGVTGSVPVRVVWSHLAQTPDGLLYRSGVFLEAPDSPWAAAVNALVRAGAIVLDSESLERKRLREIERETRRRSGAKMSVPPVTN